MIGRENELRAVDRLIQQLPDSGGALVVRGDAGLGKSTLLAEATSLAASSDVRILRATGVESATQVAFAGLEQLLRPIRDRIGALAPPQRAALHSAFGQTDAPVPDLFLIALATLNLIADAAADVPILIVVEDGQWLDRATADVIAFIARRLDFEPIALIGAARTDYPEALAAVPALELAPLTEPAAATLLDSRFPDLPPAVRRRVLDEAAGNPLALVELPAGLVDAGTTFLPLSERLERAFGARTVGLPDPTLLLLLIAAVDDGDSLSEILAAGGDRTVDDLAPAVAAGLVELPGGRLRFRHPLVRSAIVQQATTGQRHRAHAALAETLATQTDRRAWHRGESVVGPDDDIAAELDAAGTRALRRGGVETAVATFERAAQLSADPSLRADRLLKAADLATELGQREACVRLLDQAEALDLNRSQRTLAAWARDAFDDGIHDLVANVRRQADLAERIAADGDTDLALKLLYRAAIRCFFVEPGDDARARIADAALTITTDPIDRRLLAILGHASPIEHGRLVQERLPQAIEQVGGDPVAARLVGVTASAVGAFDVGLALMTTAVAGLRAQGRLALLARATSVHCWCALQLMDLGAAITSAQEAVRLARETSQPSIALLARSLESQIAALRGDDDTAEQIAAEVEREAVPGGVRPALSMTQIARGLSALGVGRYSDAFEHLRRVFDPADPAYHLVNKFSYLGDVVEAGLRSGYRDEAQRLLTEMEAIGLRTPSPTLHINLRFARALMAAESEAEELFGTALRADLARWPFARARVQLAYGEWLRRHRRPADARPHLRAARETFDALGVIGWGDRARSELRASGEASRGRVAQASELLTPQELQIAQMAADGLTNREIGQKLYLSHRTISTHLHRIYPKLGVTSRGALRAALPGTVT
ncbi:ATP-binding protein [Cryptosporangium phraense]|uniref:AAA family ATPase n=1 Tax=Cryptosporangium phraense TaxID=2593070 RepID=A0A545AGC6_9ACTN|nr:helix-turn-helix transcriptional regulator [Cryptosporangium phraense]TQS39695.1 AAA family ATPase [Cryptosporangium phraense]